jgi:hypothetical protein
MRVFRAAMLTIGALIIVIVIVVIALLASWKTTAKDAVIQRTISPDGRLFAEMHTRITTMHGGPDLLYVTVGEVSQPFGSQVYSRTFECSTTTPFGLEWRTNQELVVRYGSCNASTLSDQSGNEEKRENAVWQREASWRNVKIDYVDTHLRITR